MNVDISSISHYRVNYCVSALLSLRANCTLTVDNCFLFIGYCSLVDLFLWYL